jgi:hypothetical protein
MRRGLALFLPLVLAGCAAASASALDADVITLKDGTQLVGELVDLQDGKYWFMRRDGVMVAVAFRDVARVEMHGSEAVPAADLPLPEWGEAPAKTGEAGTIGGGFDFGLSMGGRLRFHVESPAVDHVDVRVGENLFWASGLGVVLGVSGEIAFFGESPVHLSLALDAGPGLFSGSLYPFVGAGAGVIADPQGPFEFHAGVLVGTNFSSFAVGPDLAVAWVW